MTRNPVGWFEIYVSNMARARAFYERTLACSLQRLEGPPGDTAEMWSFPMQQEEAPGASGALVKMEHGPSGGGASTIVYFSCDDCAVEAGRVKEAGGHVEKEKFSIGPYGFIALAVDTEGNMIGLHSMR